MELLKHYMINNDKRQSHLQLRNEAKHTSSDYVMGTDDISFVNMRQNIKTYLAITVLSVVYNKYFITSLPVTLRNVSSVAGMISLGIG